MFKGVEIDGKFIPQSILSSEDKWLIRLSKSSILEPIWLWRRSTEIKRLSGKPDFICIGAQRAGTTWLFSQLKDLNELFLPDIAKELHYFDWQLYKPLSWYGNLFNNGKIKGEITPGYSVLNTRRIALIKKVNPKLKIILIIRNPIERAWSHMVMNLIRDPKRSFSNISEREIIEHLKSKKSIERGAFKQIITKWEKHFPTEQICYCFYEDIRKNPNLLLRKILTFFGVEDTYDPSKNIAVLNKGLNIPMDTKFRKLLSELYDKDIEYLESRFGVKYR